MMLRSDDFSQDYVDMWARHHVEQIDEPQIEPEPMTQHERLARQRLRHTRYLFGIIAAQAVVIAGLAWRLMA